MYEGTDSRPQINSQYSNWFKLSAGLITVLCNWNWSWKRNSLSFPFHFPYLFHTNSPDGNFCETVFTHFPPCGGNLFTRQGILFPYWGNTIPQFPPDFPQFPNDSYWFPLIPQFPVQFSIQLHKCTLSLSIRPILCILHVSLKMRIPHYARQRIINLRNSGEIQGVLGKSDEKLFIFSLVFPGVKYISFLGKSNSPDFSTGYRENWWKLLWKKVKGNSPGNVNSLSLSFHSPSRPPVSIAQYCKAGMYSIPSTAQSFYKWFGWDNTRWENCSFNVWWRSSVFSRRMNNSLLLTGLGSIIIETNYA